MQLVISFGSLSSRPVAVDDDVCDAQAAESMSIDYAGSAQAWGQDGVTWIAYLAALTQHIVLGTGILQVPVSGWR